MAPVIITINGLLAAIGLLVAWQIRRLQRALVDCTAWLDATERDLAQDLPKAARALEAGGAASREAAQRLTALKRRWQILQQVLTLIGLGQTLRRRWRR